MRHTSRALTALVVLAVLGAAVVAGCGGSPAAQPASPAATAPPSSPAGITGTIHELTPEADGLPVLLVVDDGAIPGAIDRATVSLTRDTVVWTLEGAKGTAADLGAGQMVSVWFDGPVAESYPVQAKAGVIRILLND